MEKKGSGGHRIHRVEREVREVIAMYLLTGFPEPLGGRVTVSRVSISRDLRVGRVYVTTMGDAVEQKELLTKLQGHSADVQHEVGRKLRMKFCPKLSFFLDEGLENVLRVEGILRNLRSEGEGVPPDEVADPSDED